MWYKSYGELHFDALYLKTWTGLQRTIDNQITCSQEMFEFCTMEVQGIEFVFIKKEDMIMLLDENSFLHKQFDPTNLYYLPCTESLHHFTPLSTILEPLYGGHAL